MKKKRILFYFTHKESLGHTTRILNIINYIKNKYSKKVDIYVFQAGKPQRYLPIPKGVRWFSLPYPYYSKLNFKKGSSQISIPFYGKLRANYMLSKIKDIEPDIFITEFFPFGREDCRFELMPVLAYLKRRRVKIYASIGYPYIVRGNIPILLYHCEFYDKFFIHTPRDIEFNYLTKDIQNPLLKHIYDKTFKRLGNKVIYTGYILPFNLNQLDNYESIKIRSDYNARNKILVLVSRGGGVIYPKIIASSILAKQYLPENFVFIISAGPASSKKEMLLFRGLIKRTKAKQVYLYKYLPDFLSYLKASDISINMAGYNTSVPLLYLKKHSILIPSRENPETAVGYCSEQISRAKILKKYIGSKVLDYYSFTAKDIAENIKNMDLDKIAGFSKNIKNDWFKGAEITAKYIIYG